MDELLYSKISQICATNYPEKSLRQIHKDIGGDFVCCFNALKDICKEATIDVLLERSRELERDQLLVLKLRDRLDSKPDDIAEICKELKIDPLRLVKIIYGRINYDETSSICSVQSLAEVLDDFYGGQCEIIAECEQKKFEEKVRRELEAGGISICEKPVAKPGTVRHFTLTEDLG
ncbi:hypothetical protein ACOME3_004479 [Neoechinorhynchus agilis]